MKQRQIVIVKVLVWIAALAPLAYLVYGALTNNLGADPVAEIEHTTGRWVIRLLLATLAITPLRRISGWNWLVRFRRLLGLFAFFYVCVHFLAYLWFDQNFAWASIVHDIPKRPFILVGFTALVLLIPLAVTSTAGWIRRLGGKRWNALHKLIYAAAALCIVHFWWSQKADHSRPLTYGIILAALLLTRVYFSLAKLRTRTAAA